MYNIYIYDINENNIDLQEMEYLLPSSILQHIKAYQKKDDYKLSLIGWYHLQKILETSYTIRITDEVISYNKNNKPYIKNNPLFFNIAHSNNLVVIVISKNEIGVDIELDKEVVRIKEFKMFLKNDSIVNSQDVIKNWTMMEAKVKCMGESIFNHDQIKKDAFNIVETKTIQDSKKNNYFLTICEKKHL